MQSIYHKNPNDHSDKNVLKLMYYLEKVFSITLLNFFCSIQFSSLFHKKDNINNPEKSDFLMENEA